MFILGKSNYTNFIYGHLVIRHIKYKLFDDYKKLIKKLSSKLKTSNSTKANLGDNFSLTLPTWPFFILSWFLHIRTLEFSSNGNKTANSISSVFFLFPKLLNVV
uniref:Uncharacterized 11.9 kDa protein in 16S-23S DNA spacer n=1 Tax=Auxenochlorella pyrenoidosa TaxID=3078 RepID=YCX2_AUXPY|nr:RecName: Full=Uncharacterized 11.9 kDa protein in 16S-23S DNA spacer [Auxenochlorella pyrenoidosa]CAA27480.1 hypothetical protein [Chloroidium ellipsoideum]